MFSCRWDIAFYVGIAALAHGDLDRYQKLIRNASVTAEDDFDPTKKQYGYFFKPEFFIARQLAEEFDS